MGNDVAEIWNTLSPPRALKVHRQMCTELLKLVEAVAKIFPKIEAARPGCSSGVEALCLLNNAIEKDTLLIQDCVESSKLYLWDKACGLTYTQEQIDEVRDEWATYLSSYM